ncbi:MAG: hypothetical protein ACR2GY_05400 [Phycisphaerales bacterium]
MTRRSGTSRLGPILFGIVGDDYYLGGGSPEINGIRWNIAAARYPVDDKLLVARSCQKGPVDYDAKHRILHYSAANRRVLTPVEDMIDVYGRANILDWEIYIDCIFLEGDDLSVFAINDGELYHWTHNRPEDDQWIERARVETEITGPIRVQRAGDDLYLIDEHGNVYSTPPDDRHRRLGRTHRRVEVAA